MQKNGENCNFLFAALKLMGDPKTKFLLLFLSDVRRPPFRPTIKVKICIGLAPGLTSEVGQGQSQEKLLMVGRSVGQRGDGRRRAESDGGRTEVFTSF